MGDGDDGAAKHFLFQGRCDADVQQGTLQAETVIEDVLHLHAEVIIGALGMRIIGRASDHGDLETLSKCRGEKKALEKIVHHMREMNFNGGAVRIDHYLNFPAATQLKELIEASYSGAQVTIGETGGLCSFYAEKGGMMLGFETF